MYSSIIFLILRTLSNRLIFFIAPCVCFIDAVSFIALKILNIDFRLFSFALSLFCLFMGPLLFVCLFFSLMLNELLKYIVTHLRQAIPKPLIRSSVFTSMTFHQWKRGAHVHDLSTYGLNWMMF